MILIKKRIYKKSEDKYYEVGDKASFTKEEEESIVNRGLAEFVKRQTKERKQKNKKK